MGTGLGLGTEPFRIKLCWVATWETCERRRISGRNFSGGEKQRPEIRLLSKVTPWAFVHDFLWLSKRRTRQCLFLWHPSAKREFSIRSKEKSPLAASFSHLFAGWGWGKGYWPRSVNEECLVFLPTSKSVPYITNAVDEMADYISTTTHLPLSFEYCVYLELQ